MCYAHGVMRGMQFPSAPAGPRGLEWGFPRAAGIATRGPGAHARSPRPIAVACGAAPWYVFGDPPIALAFHSVTNANAHIGWGDRDRRAR